MNVIVCYNYPTNNFGPEHITFAQRFVDSYRQYPPGADHAMAVISNGGVPSATAKSQFDSIKPGTRFLIRDNRGKDIGGYQFAAQQLPCDLMVFLGGASYIRGAGWLTRMLEAYNMYGDGLFGCTGNQGELYAKVWPHIRTTGFWCNPKIINEHPFRVGSDNQRYAYEHGPLCLTSWVLSQRKPCIVVGWKDMRPVEVCNSMPEGFHQGSQSNILIGDRLTAPPYHHCA